MDVSKFKDVMQKLSFFRGYSSLMVPLGIVLVGVLIFIPTELMSDKLKKQMAKESISKGKTVRSLSGSAVARDQWKVEQEYQQAYEKDSVQTALLAKQSTQRQLLSYKIFPEPKDTSMLIFDEFGRQFIEGIDGLITHVNARDCPTETELERNLRSSSGSRQGRRGLSRNLGEVDAAIKDILCREKAESASVYANPAELSGYEFWKEYEYAGMNEAIEHCWYWQLAYWIIEDVVNTIGAVNSGSNSVFTSPVKRLPGVAFTAGEKSARRSRGKTKAEMPRYVFSNEQALTASCTRRFCNNDIDVVHFSFAVVIDSGAVLPFMQQLCSAKEHKFSGFFGEAQEQIFKHNQITILESNINPIDCEDDTHTLYRYGEDAVVRLDLICEYIFSKSGCDEIKPELIKQPTEDVQE